MKPVLFGLTLLVLSSCVPTQQNARALKIGDLAGRWQSADCVALPDGRGGTLYRSITFDFNGDQWTIAVTMHAEQTCAVKLFGFRFTGPVALGAASSTVRGATEGTFGYQQTFFTAYAEPFVQAFNAAKCADGSFKLGIEQDTSLTGCLGQPSVKDYPREYDLVKLEDGKLYFGLRPADNNMGTPERRPTMLSPYPLVRP